MKKVKIALVSVSDPGRFGNPLALGYLKTYSDSALGARCDSRLVELSMSACLAGPAAAAGRLLKLGTDVAAFSCYMWNIDAVVAVTRALRKAGYRGKIILGGPDASGRGAALIEEAGADAVVIGEGELTFVDLLGRLLDGRPWAGTPGAVVRAGGRAKTGPARDYIRDLDIIPSPYLAGLFDGKKYRYYVYETSRGCPFRCAFCTWTSRSGLRYFSTDRALAEARVIAAVGEPFTGYKAGVELRNTTVFVTDSDITANPPRAAAIFNAVRKYSSGKKLLWMLNCSLEHWTEELARAADSGHFEFGLAVESVNEEIMTALGRRLPAGPKLQQALRNLREFAPKAKLLFHLMLGVPGDTATGFLRSLRWTLKVCAEVQPRPVLAFAAGALSGPDGDGPAQLPRAFVVAFHTSVLPGSRLEKDAARLGVKWSACAPYAVMEAPGFTAADLDSCYGALETVASLTAAAWGAPMVVFEDIRPGRKNSGRK